LNPYSDCKIYGPYIRKDNRKHIIAIFPNNKRKTISYPKYLIEKLIGKFLKENEIIHHKNENIFDNKLNNLIILNRNYHSSLHAKKYPEQKEFNCIFCYKNIILNRKQLIRLQGNRRRNKNGPFCSKLCSGKYGIIIQNNKKILHS
jgi:hypothetical protein